MVFQTGFAASAFAALQRDATHGKFSCTAGFEVRLDSFFSRIRGDSPRLSGNSLQVIEHSPETWGECRE